jgi:hypothetical protein
MPRYHSDLLEARFGTVSDLRVADYPATWLGQSIGHAEKDCNAHISSDIRYDPRVPTAQKNSGTIHSGILFCHNVEHGGGLVSHLFNHWQDKTCGV